MVSYWNRENKEKIISLISKNDYIFFKVKYWRFRALMLSEIKKMYRNCDDSEKVLIDVKGLYNVAELKASGMKFWRL